jgi:hypothetical protein
VTGPLDEGIHWATVSSHDPQRWLRLEHDAIMAKLGEDDTTRWMDRLYAARRRRPGATER